MTAGKEAYTGTTTVFQAIMSLLQDDLAELFNVKDELDASHEGFETLALKQADQDEKISAATAGSGLLISATDTGGVGYFVAKVLEGAGIVITKNNPGGAETVSFSQGPLPVHDIGTVTENTVVDLENGFVQKIAVNANITISFSNFPTSGNHKTLMLIVTDTGDRTTTWDAAVKWKDGVVPIPIANSRNRFLFCSEDGGTTIDGGFVGGGFA